MSEKINFELSEEELEGVSGGTYQQCVLLSSLLRRAGIANIEYNELERFEAMFAEYGIEFKGSLAYNESNTFSINGEKVDITRALEHILRQR